MATVCSAVEVPCESGHCVADESQLTVQNAAPKNGAIDATSYCAAHLPQVCLDQIRVVPDTLQQLSATMPALTYAYSTPASGQISHFNSSSHITTTQFVSSINGIPDQDYLYLNVHGLDQTTKLTTAPPVLQSQPHQQGTPVLVLSSNTEKGTLEANVVFDQCGMCPVMRVQPAFQTLQALAHASFVQQTQEKVAKHGDVRGTEQKKQERTYVCDVERCGRTFSTLGYLKYHQTVHNGEKSLKCNFDGCDRKFAWPAHLKYHQLTHTGERQHKCNFEGCGKHFYTAQRLKVHARIHSGEKPFICPEKGCGKAFSTAGNLKNHRRVHTGERPFVCTFDDCGKRFAEHSSLKKHKLVHSGERPFSCDVCGKTFSQSGSRNVHMKRHQLSTAATQENQSQTTNMLMELADQSVLLLRQNEEDILQYQDFQGNESIVFAQGVADQVVALTDQVVTVSTQASEEPIEIPQTIIGAEEVLQQEDAIQTDESLIASTNGANVVVLSQPHDIGTMTVYDHNHQGQGEEVVYDNDLLQTELDHEEIANSMNGNGSSQEKPCKEGMDPMMEMDEI